MVERDKKALIKNTLQTVVGLFIFAFGQYFCVSADIGLAPWDCLAMGLSKHIPLNFGNCCSVISLTIVLIDILMKEKIGMGTLLDAILVGQFVNFFRFTNILLPLVFHNTLTGIAFMLCGLFIMALGQTIYMSSGIGCGPRDALMVGIGKRIKKVPISFVMFLIQFIVVLIGWPLGGPIGIGTIISVVFAGVSMQIVYLMLRIELRDIVHIDIIKYVQLLFKNTAKIEDN